MKKYLIPVISIICIAAVIFIACSAQKPAAQPVDAPAENVPAVEPIDTAEPEPEPAVEPEPEPEPQPESEPEPHCNFDEAVQEFIESNPDIDLTIDPTPLYEYLLSENIDANDINRNCNNEYRDGYTSWFNRGGSISLSELIPSDELANIQTHERSQEEIDADYEEQKRLAMEIQRQSEEEGAQHRAQLTEDLKGMDFDRSETFNF